MSEKDGGPAMTEIDRTSLLPCPCCGRQPRVYHGVHGGIYGDSVECECGPDEDWQYTGREEAVRRWNAFASRLRTQGE